MAITSISRGWPLLHLRLSLQQPYRAKHAGTRGNAHQCLDSFCLGSIANLFSKGNDGAPSFTNVSKTDRQSVSTWIGRKSGGVN
eukprot:5031290-Amphidinium_carterae.1